VALRPVVAGQDERAAAVVDARRVPGRVAALLAHQPGELGQELERRVAARALVHLDDGVALATLHRHRDDLLGQAALVRRLDRQLVGAQRPAVEIGARELELVADLRGLVEHLAAAERVREAVVDHRVEGLGVAHAVAEPRLRQQVGRLRHRLHAAPDGDLHLARADLRVQDRRRPDAGGADLVDRLGGDLLRDPGLDLGLAGGDLALTRLQDLPHHDVLDLLGRHVGALERALDGQTAELRGVERAEAAAELADRRAGGAEDDGLGHVGRGLR
jgi:hypothetical protein